MLPPFQRVLDDHRSDVWRFLVASVGSVEAEDCFQATFLAALRAYPRLRNARNLKAWLMTIAHRKAMDAHRQRRRELPVAVLPEVPAATPANGDPGLWRAVRQLPPKQRTAIAYRFVSDLTYKDIASVMACTEAAARQSVHEGITRLREVLAE